MAYRFHRKEAVAVGFRRIAREQLQKAINEIHDREIDNDTTVHQVRKRLKKLRALVRLVRPGLGSTYKKLNTEFRDMGRELSRLRDADTRIVTFDQLVDSNLPSGCSSSIDKVRQILIDQRQAIAADWTDLESDLENLSGRLQTLYDQSGEWEIQGDPEAVAMDGLHNIYKQSRKSCKVASKNPSDINLHDWRKRTKYHWYHVRLIRNTWKPIMRAREKELSRLSDLLGDDHDLAVLTAHFRANARTFSSVGKETFDTVAELTEKRRKVLQEEAFSIGRRINAEGSKPLSKRLSRYWKIWKK